ncbi:MAG: hypothetical protein QM731_20990 [Chitinophagaceae bacterium]
MKKITFILVFILMVVVGFSVPGRKTVTANAKTLLDAYCATSNATNDYIYVHLWNASHNYNFTVPPHAAAGYVMGQIEADCYNVTLTSSGGPHTMQFYWYNAGYVTTGTYSGGDLCATCTSCPSLRIYN